MIFGCEFFDQESIDLNKPCPMILIRQASVVLGILCCSAAMAQCPIPFYPDNDVAHAFTNIVDNFGACPDDGESDHAAFLAAARFYNNRFGRGTLKIPAGVYIVGRQGPPTSAPGWANPNGFVSHQNVMSLFDCDDLTIHGVLNPDGTTASIIRFEDCLSYGRFTTVGGTPMVYEPDCDETMCCAPSCANPPPSGCCPPPNPLPVNQSAAVGIMFRLRGCDRLTIRDLELDGNVRSQLLGGGYSCADDGIQLAYDGIVLGNQDDAGSVNQSLRLSNLNIHHFGRDGMIILRGPEASMDLSATDCHFDYNERTGVAWTGGRGVNFENCSFNFNSTGRIRSAMGAGLVIEHEFGSQCGDGRFMRCNFQHNRVTGMATNTKAIGSDVAFDECVFKSALATFPNLFSPTSTAVWPSGPYLRFNSCNFYGPIDRGYHNPQTAQTCNSSDARSTQFNFCSFNEADETWSYFNWTPVGSNYTVPSLVHMNAASGTTFYGCHFEAGCRSRFFQVAGRPNKEGCPACSNNIVFSGCRFLSHGSWGAATAPPLSMFTGTNVTFNDAAVSWPNRVRTEGGGLLSGIWNYRMNTGWLEGFDILVTGCTNWGGDTSVVELGGSSDAAAIQFYTTRPCLPLFENPDTPREVIPCVQNEGNVPSISPVAICNRQKQNHTNGPPEVGVEASIVVSDGYLMVELPGTFTRGAARMYDSMGKVVMEYQVNSGHNAIPIHSLAEGAYVLQVNGIIEPHRFVVSR